MELRNAPNLCVPITTYVRIPNVNDDFMLDSKSFRISMKYEKLRLETFTFAGWPRDTPTMHDLASSGFFHLLVADFTQCAFCNMVVAVWDKCTNVDDFHLTQNSNCRFMKKENVGNIAINSSTQTNEAVDRLLCCICSEVEKNVAFFPCGHCCCCEKCGLNHSVGKCPLCRKNILNRQKIIL
ncbi:hypothetical protein B4U80_14003 [Leptotrombidium deliense]|uniref:RING-type domain-containing protein n=1 Tax=Leptotrombidium deliense TaxID=299467 RepID=A0A443S598_9ACAR|nr:hypothetical protein B4U80_14003 [Leptotrombidium deliense]